MRIYFDHIHKCIRASILSSIFVAPTFKPLFCLCVCLSAATDSPISKPTPLYGQPSWWGEDEDTANIKQERGGKFPGLAKFLLLIKAFFVLN